MKDYKPPSYEEKISDATSSKTNKGFEPDTGTFRPPTAPPMQAPIPERSAFIPFGVLSDQDLRDACYEYITDQCCYGSRFIKDMVLVDILNTYSFRYKLESFGEKRETKWTFEAYYGQTIDGPENGLPPSAWDVRVPDPTKFVNGQVSAEVPHTATVEVCSTCSGNGHARCSYCYGDGFNKCTRCGGRGSNSEDGRCMSCAGRGSRTCSTCNSSGRVKCSPCNGNGHLKRFMQLIVSWTNHVDTFISDSMKLPKELIRAMNAKQITIEEDAQVFPLTHIPDNAVIEASSQLIRKHQNSFTDEMIRAQRHTLCAVPLTRAKYSWKRWQDEFYVYGFEKKVYFEHYPQQCCCCTCC